MVKFLFTWKKNPDLTEEECEAHYLKVHTELARKALGDSPGLRRYVQNKVVRHLVHNFNGPEPVEAEPEFDRFVELYFDSRETMEEAFSSPGVRACFDDHKNFMDVNIPASLKVYEVIEAIPLDR